MEKIKPCPKELKYLKCILKPSMVEGKHHLQISCQINDIVYGKDALIPTNDEFWMYWDNAFKNAEFCIGKMLCNAVKNGDVKPVTNLDRRSGEGK